MSVKSTGSSGLTCQGGYSSWGRFELELAQTHFRKTFERFSRKKDYFRNNFRNSKNIFNNFHEIREKKQFRGTSIVGSGEIVQHISFPAWLIIYNFRLLTNDKRNWFENHLQVLQILFRETPPLLFSQTFSRYFSDLEQVLHLVMNQDLVVAVILVHQSQTMVRIRQAHTVKNCY